jgi:hypothetical protein
LQAFGYAVTDREHAINGQKVYAAFRPAEQRHRQELMLEEVELGELLTEEAGVVGGRPLPPLITDGLDVLADRGTDDAELRGHLPVGEVRGNELGDLLATLLDVVQLVAFGRAARVVRVARCHVLDDNCGAIGRRGPLPLLADC